MMTEAWHFVGDTLRDGTPIPPDGEWLNYKGKCVMCQSGLHASIRIIDALTYASKCAMWEIEEVAAATEERPPIYHGYCGLKRGTP